MATNLAGKILARVRFSILLHFINLKCLKLLNINFLIPPREKSDVVRIENQFGELDSRISTPPPPQKKFV
jgi:phage FluMu protein Com